MAEYTPNLNLRLSTDDEIIDHTVHFRPNFQTIDTKIGNLDKLPTNDKSSLVNSMIESNTKINNMTADIEKKANQTDVDNINLTLEDILNESNTGTEFPTNPKVGQRFYKTDETLWYTYDSSGSWIAGANKKQVDDLTTNVYTKSDMDSKLEGINRNPFFLINNTAQYGYATANSSYTLPFTAGCVSYSSGFTANTNNTITCNVDGYYFVNLQVHISGLNADCNSNIYIRVIRPDGTSYDNIHQMRGASGQGGNSGGVWYNHSLILKMPAKTKLTFLIQIGEAPRQIIQTIVNCFKVSQLV